MVNHNPICRCPQGLTGDPFTACTVIGERSRQNEKVKIISTDNIEADNYFADNVL